MLCCAVHMGSTRRTRVHGSFEKKAAHHIDFGFGFCSFFFVLGSVPGRNRILGLGLGNGFGFGFGQRFWFWVWGSRNGVGFGVRVTVLGLGLGFELLDPDGPGTHTFRCTYLVQAPRWALWDGAFDAALPYTHRVFDRCKSGSS